MCFVIYSILTEVKGIDMTKTSVRTTGYRSTAPQTAASKMVIQ